MTTEQLNDIRKRCAAATPGSWRTPPSFAGVVSQNHGDIVYTNINNKNYRNDIRFIMYARDDIPALLSALEAEKARAETAEAEAEKWIKHAGKLNGLWQDERQRAETAKAERDELEQRIVTNQDLLLKAIERAETAEARCKTLQCCGTCEYWMWKYCKCEHPEQRESECGDYQKDVHDSCELWQVGTAQIGGNE